MQTNAGLAACHWSRELSVINDLIGRTTGADPIFTTREPDREAKGSRSAIRTRRRQPGAPPTPAAERRSRPTVQPPVQQLIADRSCGSVHHTYTGTPPTGGPSRS